MLVEQRGWEAKSLALLMEAIQPYNQNGSVLHLMAASQQQEEQQRQIQDLLLEILETQQKQQKLHFIVQ